MKKFLSSLLVLVIALGFALALTSQVHLVAHAQTGLFDQPGSRGVGQVGNTGEDVVANIQTIINFALGFVGLIATIMAIYGGFLYITSAGASETATKGKTILIMAIIGIVIIVLAFSIISTIITGISGS